MTISKSKLPKPDPVIRRIESLLSKAMPVDRHAVKSALERIKRAEKRGLTKEKKQEKLIYLEKRVLSSIQQRTWRKEHLPALIYNKTLPIWSKKDDIIDAIRKNRVIIIAGETGSGKTTQIPKFCLAAGRGIDGKIGCTQPRRIAATMVAHRIAEELGQEIGRAVGYKIRFKERTSPGSFIKIMTDGILLAETQTDPYLYGYDTIIVDEAHERNLNIDFILGIVKTLLCKRKDLKLIITSATIDTEKFSAAFDHAPVIEVSGRMYPVEVEYLPADSEQPDNGEQNHVEAAVAAADNLCRQTLSGDMLIFMPTEQDIRETCDLLEGRKHPGLTVLPLFARLSEIEQKRVFSRTSGRKIIVATNIAETSITLPGIKYVIDTGLARISQYAPHARITSLPVVSVSQSSADQRKGRCGRVENGVCIRLFSEEDFLLRPRFTPPEIIRSNLAEVILRMISLKLGNIHNFPFIDQPLPRSIKDGFDLLLELGAITHGQEKKPAKQNQKYLLTEIGELMAKMPIDPRLSRMLIEAEKEDCLTELCIIAAALSIRDPRERPADKTDEADQAHAAFNDPQSDFVTLLNIWKAYYKALEAGNGWGGVRKFCKANYLSFRRMREWRDIHFQISTIVKECGFMQKRVSGKISQEESRYAAIHKSILSGFLSNIAVKKEKYIYQAGRGKEVMIFPGSGLFNSAGSWIVASELIETSRLFARTVANIDSNWLEALGKDQCKYTYLDPHWERNRGEVVASEQVSLYGLIIVEKRPVSYGKANPLEASDIFIKSALVDGDVKKPFPFMVHNKAMIDEIINLENKIRRRDMLISDEEIFLFYRERLPHIYDIRTLERHIQKNRSDRFLRMTKDRLLRYCPDENELSLFPDTVSLGDDRFACEYRFNPGQHDDGVTVAIPQAAAPAVPLESIDWLVPGLFKEKLMALIKGLPKSYRKKLVPVADTVEIIAKEMPKNRTYLSSALSVFLHHRFNIDIPASAWPVDNLPDHLKMRISLTDPEGREVFSDRDKVVLRQNIKKQYHAEEFETAKSKREKTGITRWDFGDLPDTVELTGENGVKGLFYPGLEIDNIGVGLRLFRQADEAMLAHKKGVASLFAKHLAKELKFLKRMLTLPDALTKQADYFGGKRRLEGKIYDCVIRDLFEKNIRTEADFLSHARSVRPYLQDIGKKKIENVIRVLDAYHESRSVISDLKAANRGNRTALDLFNTLSGELSKLVPDAFVDLYDTERLGHLARYIKAITIRAQRAVHHIEKDRVKAKQLQPITDSLDRLLNDLSPTASAEKRAMIEDYYWLIEEYKISLFAQEIKTVAPVSRKRLDKKLKEIQRIV